jgi:hypothetical protein
VASSQHARKARRRIAGKLGPDRRERALYSGAMDERTRIRLTKYSTKAG